MGFAVPVLVVLVAVLAAQPQAQTQAQVLSQLRVDEASLFDADDDGTTTASLGLMPGGGDQEALPLVVAHGMGDSCFNPGMEQITSLAGKRRGVYSVCVPDGSSQVGDTTNAFLTTMGAQVADFAARVRADSKLRGGFDAMGLSQGNLVIRGYVERFNDPPVRRFLSVHGPLAGVASLPRCNPDGLAGALCREVTDIVGDVAYSDAVQNLVAQSNYLKVPTELPAYLAHNVFLPTLNNEVPHADAGKYKANMESLEKLILVMAEDDTMIFPKESEHFGFFADGQFKDVLPVNETKAYKTNAFGIKTLMDAGKVLFRSSKGNHLQFKIEDLNKWLDEL